MNTSLFSVVNNTSASSSSLINDFVKIQNWAYMWKIWFNPGPAKKSARECFFQNVISLTHPSVFKNTKIEGTLAQKHLHLNLDQKLTFTFRNCALFYFAHPY